MTNRVKLYLIGQTTLGLFGLIIISVISYNVGYSEGHRELNGSVTCSRYCAEKIDLRKDNGFHIRYEVVLKDRINCECFMEEKTGMTRFFSRYIDSEGKES